MLAQKILSLTVYSFDWGCGSNSANRYNLILSSTQKKNKKEEEENEFANSRGFDFCFGGRRMGKSLFWRKEKRNGGGKRKGLHFVCQR